MFQRCFKSQRTNNYSSTLCVFKSQRKKGNTQKGLAFASKSISFISVISAGQIITQAPCVFLSPNERMEQREQSQIHLSYAEPREQRAPLKACFHLAASRSRKTISQSRETKTLDQRKEIRRKGWLLPAKAFLLFLSFLRDKYKLFYDFCFNFERSDQLIAPTKGYKLCIYEYYR